MPDYKELAALIRGSSYPHPTLDIQASDAIEALQAENERLREELSHALSSVASLQAENEKLKREIHKFARDSLWDESKLVDDWRTNYGLHDKSPGDAAMWWHEQLGYAPIGAVAALGTAIQMIERLREELAAAQRDAARYRWLRDVADHPAICDVLPDGEWVPLLSSAVDGMVDAARKNQK